MAIIGIVVLARLRDRDPWKASIWIGVSACLLMASAMAAAAHGLELPGGVYAIVWRLIYLSLGLMVAGAGVGAAHDLWGERASRKTAPIMAIVAMLFFIIVEFSDKFELFILYEALFMGLACLAYGYLAVTRRLPGAGLVCAGILVTLLAAAVQATRVIPSISIVWVFDHNGQFHLLQVPGLILMCLGLRAALRAQERSEVAALPRRTP